MCSNGHNFCEECLRKSCLYSSRCPTCRVGIERPARNVFLQNFLRRRTSTCRHYGCNRVMSRERLLVHETICLYAPARCHCDWQGIAMNLPAHQNGCLQYLVHTEVQREVLTLRQEVMSLREKFCHLEQVRKSGMFMMTRVFQSYLCLCRKR